MFLVDNEAIEGCNIVNQCIINNKVIHVDVPCTLDKIIEYQ